MRQHTSGKGFNDFKDVKKTSFSRTARLTTIAEIAEEMKNEQASDIYDETILKFIEAITVSLRKADTQTLSYSLAQLYRYSADSSARTLTDPAKVFHELTILLIGLPKDEILIGNIPVARIIIRSCCRMLLLLAPDVLQRKTINEYAKKFLVFKSCLTRYRKLSVELDHHLRLIDCGLKLLRDFPMHMSSATRAFKASLSIHIGPSSKSLSRIIEEAQKHLLPAYNSVDLESIGEKEYVLSSKIQGSGRLLHLMADRHREAPMQLRLSLLTSVENLWKQCEEAGGLRSGSGGVTWCVHIAYLDSLEGAHHPREMNSKLFGKILNGVASLISYESKSVFNKSNDKKICAKAIAVAKHYAVNSIDGSVRASASRTIQRMSNRHRGPQERLALSGKKVLLSAFLRANAIPRNNSRSKVSKCKSPNLRKRAASPQKAREFEETSSIDKDLNNFLNVLSKKDNRISNKDEDESTISLDLDKLVKEGIITGKDIGRITQNIRRNFNGRIKSPTAAMLRYGLETFIPQYAASTFASLRVRSTHFPLEVSEKSSTLWNYLRGQEKKCITILGGSGTGKTTLAYYIAREIWKLHDEGDLQLRMRQIPLIVQLSDVHDPGKDFMKKVMSIHGINDEKEAEELRKNAEIIIILDGFNELPERHKLDFYTQITVNEAWSNARIVYTSRNSFKGESRLCEFLQAPFLDISRSSDSYAEIWIAPLTEEQVDQYIRKWVEMNPSRKQAEIEAELSIDSNLKTVFQSERLQTLAAESKWFVNVDEKQMDDYLRIRSKIDSDQKVEFGLSKNNKSLERFKLAEVLNFDLDRLEALEANIRELKHRIETSGVTIEFKYYGDGESKNGSKDGHSEAIDIKQEDMELESESFGGDESDDTTFNNLESSIRGAEEVRKRIAGIVNAEMVQFLSVVKLCKETRRRKDEIWRRIHSLNGLRELVKTPLLLSISLHTLQSLQGVDINRLSIYEALMRKCFPATRESKTSRCSGKTDAFVLKCGKNPGLMIVRILASTMMCDEKVALGHGDLQHILQRLKLDTVQNMMKIVNTQGDVWGKFLQESSLLVTQDYKRDTSREQYYVKFAHRSFMEYFAAIQIISEILNFGEKAPPSLSHRLYVSDESLMMFLSEIISRDRSLVALNTPGFTCRTIDSLVHIVRASAIRDNSESESERNEIAAGNAISALTQAQVSLHGCDLEGIQIPGANLEGCDLSFTDLTGANLERTNMTGIKLRGAKLSYARLLGFKNENFMEIKTKLPVLQLSMTRNASRVVALAKGGSISVYSTADGKHMWEKRDVAATSLCVSPKSRYVATGSADRTAKIWNINSGQMVGQPFSGHTRKVSDVAFSPDGSLLASASQDNFVILWDVRTGMRLREVAHTTFVAKIHFSGDGRNLISTDCDRVIRVWRVSNGQQIRRNDLFKRLRTSNLAFCPDGKRVVLGEREYVRIRQLTNGQTLRTLTGHSRYVTRVEVSPNGKYIVSASLDGFIKVWELDTGVLLRSHEGHAGPVISVDFSPDGKKVVSGGNDCRICIWSEVVRTAPTRSVFGHPANPNGVVCVSFSRDGLRVASRCSSYVKVWDVTTAAEIRSIPTEWMILRWKHSSMELAHVLSADGKRLAAGCSDMRVRVWHVRSGKEMFVSEENKHLSCTALSPNGNMVAAICMSQGVGLKIWDVITRTINIVKPKFKAITMIFGPKGKKIIFGRENSSVAIFHIKSGLTQIFRQLPRTRTLSTIKRKREPISSVAFCPHGKLIASGCFDATITLWSVNKVQEIQNFTGHTSGVTSVAFSPDGKRIASGSTDRTVKIWSLEANTKVRTLSGYPVGIASVAFGHNVVAVGYGTVVQLVSADFESKETRVLWEHAGCIRSADFKRTEFNHARGLTTNDVKFLERCGAKNARVSDVSDDLSIDVASEKSSSTVASLSLRRTSGSSSPVACLSLRGTVTCKTTPSCFIQ